MTLIGLSLECNFWIIKNENQVLNLDIFFLNKTRKSLLGCLNQEKINSDMTWYNSKLS